VLRRARRDAGRPTAGGRTPKEAPAVATEEVPAPVPPAPATVEEKVEEKAVEMEEKAMHAQQGAARVGAGGDPSFVPYFARLLVASPWPGHRWRSPWPVRSHRPRPDLVELAVARPPPSSSRDSSAPAAYISSTGLGLPWPAPPRSHQVGRPRPRSFSRHLLPPALVLRRLHPTPLSCLRGVGKERLKKKLTLGSHTSVTSNGRKDG
jgi:hypothetical protein